jgi:hypothetical protein
MMRRAFTYEVTGGGIDSDGWWKWEVLRSDGMELRVTKKRMRELRKQGRITQTESLNNRTPFHR